MTTTPAAREPRPCCIGDRRPVGASLPTYDDALVPLDAAPVLPCDRAGAYRL
ncbi:hypothetical protein [Streptomyces sp. NPDC055287]